MPTLSLLVLFVVDVVGLHRRGHWPEQVPAVKLTSCAPSLRVTSDKLTTVLGAGAMTADTILDEQKLQLALAKLEGRENAAELRAGADCSVPAALRAKLTRRRARTT